MITPPSVGDLVKVSWLDAFGNATQDYNQKDITDAVPYKMTTYGILVRHDTDITDPKSLVGIAAEVSEDGHYRGVTFIPRQIVVHIERAGQRAVPRKRKPKALAPA